MTDMCATAILCRDRHGAYVRGVPIVHRFNHDPGPPERQAEIVRRALGLIAAHMPENGNELATKEIQRLMNEDTQTAVNVFFASGAIANGFVQSAAIDDEVSPTAMLAGIERDYLEELGL